MYDKNKRETYNSLYVVELPNKNLFLESYAVDENDVIQYKWTKNMEKADVYHIKEHNISTNIFSKRTDIAFIYLGDNRILEYMS
jgi:hypothetical protein